MPRGSVLMEGVTSWNGPKEQSQTGNNLRRSEEHESREEEEGEGGREVESLEMKAETLTLVLVNLASIMERADESLLPGVYKEVGAALHTDPTGLGSLTLFRSVVQSSSYPLAVYLAARHNRTHVIALGAFLWAAATFLVAFSSTFFQVCSQLFPIQTNHALFL